MQKTTSEDRSVRLQKFIADCGITSRRKAEELIVQGRVLVNGVVADQLGTKVDPEKDAVSVDGQYVDLKGKEKVYLVLHKPRGYVTTVHDPEGRPTVMDFCTDIAERIYPVGRLDYLSEGLLILTNDGDVANTIMHPKFNVNKVYEVKVFGVVSERLLNTLREGTVIEGQRVKPQHVRIIKELPQKTWLEFRLGEGKNREIRRICEDNGVIVDKLKRVAIGGLSVDGIAPGRYRLFNKKQLLKAIGINENGTASAQPSEYVSTRKSIRFKHRNATRGTSADQPVFQQFKRDVYFQTMSKLKEQRLLEQTQAQATEGKTL